MIHTACVELSCCFGPWQHGDLVEQSVFIAHPQSHCYVVSQRPNLVETASTTTYRRHDNDPPKFTNGPSAAAIDPSTRCTGPEKQKHQWISFQAQKVSHQFLSVTAENGSTLSKAAKMDADCLCWTLCHPFFVQHLGGIFCCHA